MNEINTLNGLATGIREKHQAALEAVSVMEDLGRDVIELREIQAEIRKEDAHA